ncbi:ABC transporter permease [Roseivirga sp.]|uniref:ABC transporter permease n=1 Tax=Roseivirga sp. TaxID=1964215 RepID=UPI003B517AE2
MLLKVFFRSVRKRFSYFLIKVAGLSLALMFGILVFLFVKSELGYDRFHDDPEDIYRVATYIGFRGGMESEGTPFLLAESMLENMPVVQKASHLIYIGGMELSRGADTYTTPVHLADRGFLQMFNFKMTQGDGQQALSDPNTVIISESLAREVFGGSEVVNESITVHVNQEKKVFRIGAVAQDVPENSSIEFDLLISDLNAPQFMGESIMNSWTPFKSNVVTFFKSIENTDREVLVNGLNEIADLNGLSQRLNSKSQPERLPIMRLTDVHFKNNPDVRFLKERGNLNYLYILSSIAVLILLVAAMNFANLSLGLSVVRSKEIGVRKVLGSSQFSLRKQFLFESSATVGISLLLGMLMAYLYLPQFNSLLDKQLSLNFFQAPETLLAILLIGIVTSLLSGMYPAYVIASQKVLTSLKGKASIQHKWLPNSMTVFQFGISMLLVIIALIMQSQLRHMANYDLGFDKEHLIYQTFDYSLSPSDAEVRRFMEEAMKDPSVLGMSGTRGGLIENEDETLWSVTINDESLFIPSVKVGYDFIPMMGISLAEGRNFSRESPADAEAIIVNQAFVEVMELEDPVGKTVNLGSVSPLVIGVVEDFRFKSLRTAVSPLILNLRPGSPNTAILTRIDGRNTAQALGHLKDTWEQLNMKQPSYEFHFFEDDLNRQYVSESNFKSVVSYASFFAMITSFIGLIGLCNLNLNRRVKEISLRRVLGANMLSVMLLFLKETGKLLFISAVIFWPLAFIYLEGWLANFNVRTIQSPAIYLSIGLIVTATAAILILFVIRKTSSANPANVLRSE